MSLLYLQNNSAIQNLFKKLLWNRTCIEQVEDESLKIILPIQNLKGLLTLKLLFLKLMSSNFQAIFTSKEVSNSIEKFSSNCYKNSVNHEWKTLFWNLTDSNSQSISTSNKLSVDWKFSSNCCVNQQRKTLLTLYAWFWNLTASKFLAISSASCVIPTLSMLQMIETTTPSGTAFASVDIFRIFGFWSPIWWSGSGPVKGF